MRTMAAPRRRRWSRPGLAVTTTPGFVRGIGFSASLASRRCAWIASCVLLSVLLHSFAFVAVFVGPKKAPTKVTIVVDAVMHVQQ